MANEMREKLAELCHEQWSGWMKYLFEQCDATGDGCVEIPRRAVARWKHQMSTPYKALTEDEQNSDRKEADKFIKLLEE